MKPFYSDNIPAVQYGLTKKVYLRSLNEESVRVRTPHENKNRHTSLVLWKHHVNLFLYTIFICYISEIVAIINLRRVYTKLN